MQHANSCNLTRLARRELDELTMNSMKANEISREDWMLRRISTRALLSVER